MTRDIVSWSLGYLQGISIYPVRGEYSISNLLYSYWLHKEYLDNDLTGESAAKSDYEKDRLGWAWYASPESRAVDVAWKKFSDALPLPADSEDWTDSRALARKLEKSRGDEVEYRGRARGRRYRNKETRPKISDEIIARLIESVMKDYEDEMSWMDLLDPIQNWLLEFHRICEGNPKKANHYWEKSIHVSLEEMKPIEFSFSLSQSGKEADIQDKYIGKFNSNLEDWVEEVYSEGWFSTASSNIQRYLRNSGDVVKGSKRGQWVHKKYRDEVQTNEISKEEETMEKMREISVLIRLFVNSLPPSDPIGKARLLQLQTEFELFNSQINDIIEESDGEALVAN